jgi:phi LC3 family holin
MQNRLKSKVFWIAVLSAIAMLLKAFGVFEISDQVINSIVDVVFSALTVFGIANNPTDKNNF